MKRCLYEIIVIVFRYCISKAKCYFCIYYYFYYYLFTRQQYLSHGGGASSDNSDNSLNSGLNISFGIIYSEAEQIHFHGLRISLWLGS